MNCGERGRTAVDSNSLKRGRYGLLRTGVDYSRCPFKEEVMGSNPIRATDRVIVGRYAMLVLRSAPICCQRR